MTILITGATGFVGKNLGIALVRAGHKLVITSRNKEKARKNIPFPAEVIQWDGLSKIDSPLLKKVDGVFHLMGENLGQGSWSDQRKTRIFHSRVESSKNLIFSFKELGEKKLNFFLGASAIGIYGDRGDEILNEESDISLEKGFMEKVCRSWEAAYEQDLEAITKRQVVLRLGVVLGAEEGFLKELLPIFQYGLGARLGSGKQWLPWIHMKDLVSLLLEMLHKDSYQGIYNGVAPEPITNREMTQSMVRVLGAFSGPAVPGVALKLVLGEKSQMVLMSSRVTSCRLGEFDFQFKKFDEAITHEWSPLKDGGFLKFTRQWIPKDKESTFNFFKDENNLEKITPKSLRFKILGKDTEEIQEGTHIDYKISVHGIPMKWRTLITHWDPPNSFADLQMQGPYKEWHHTHIFYELGEGTVLEDRVIYKLPAGHLGRLVSGWLVHRDVSSIFSHRREVIHELFGENA